MRTSLPSCGEARGGCATGAVVLVGVALTERLRAIQTVRRGVVEKAWKAGGAACEYGVHERGVGIKLWSCRGCSFVRACTVSRARGPRESQRRR